MYCRHCGTMIPDDSIFCSKCGKNVKKNEWQANDVNIGQNKDVHGEEQLQWYYHDNNMVVGPVSQMEIETAIRNGQVDIENGEVRVGQDGQWVPLLNSIFFRVTNNPSSLPQVAISDKWIWCLAIIPLVVSVILGHIEAMSSLASLPWIVSLALNGLFIRLDKIELLNADLQAESWMYMGIVLVPLYLIVREIKTNHNYVPAIIWCFIFAIDLFVL